MKFTNILGYPSAYVDAAKKSSYQPKADRIGVTALIDSPQVRRLLIEKWDDIILDVDDFFTGMLGTAFHKHLETNSTDGTILTEKKWEIVFNGVTIVGVADVVTGGENTTIADYKLLSAWSWVFDKAAAWTKQLNILRWLAFKVDGVTIDNLVVHAFIKDWSYYQAQQNEDFPQSRYMMVRIPIWPMEKTEAYIVERIKLHLDKKYVCTNEDRWERHETFQVKKVDSTRALKGSAENPLTKDEALKYISEKGLTKDFQSGKILVTEKRTEPKRCTSFCNCRSVCPYAKGLRK